MRRVGLARRAFRLYAAAPALPHRAWPPATDVLLFATGLAVLYGVVSAARTWLGPVTAEVPISHSPWALPVYAGYSLLRMLLAYLLSLVFAIASAYLAAYSVRAERLVIPLLDVLQSLPVLSFLPGVMLAMVALFPQRQLGVELGAILLIFTGQVWNMAFSVYASLKGIPREMREAASVYRFSRWQRFSEVELPFSAIGLVWNSMMSVAGGWFFLMACEMFVLGSRDFRLPGLGSYLQTAASAGDTTAIAWGLAVMIALIVLLDQLVWRPVIAWAEKFRLEQVEGTAPARSAVLELVGRSLVLAGLRRRLLRPLRERVLLHFARAAQGAMHGVGSRPPATWAVRVVGVTVIVVVAYAVLRALAMLATVSPTEVLRMIVGLAATFLRVLLALAIGTAWTVPVGVAIGLNPRLARVAQPLAQIAASVPATALFPVVLLIIIQWGGGLGVGSIVLLLLGTQWYILFNVIAGATAIPADLKDAAAAFGLTRSLRWRKLILPAIFPYLVTGLLTASGGAWNASIVAEYFHFKGRTYATTGLGATISQATDAGDFPALLASTVLMAAAVVTINRLVWRRLYALAEARFTLEG